MIQAQAWPSLNSDGSTKPRAAFDDALQAYSAAAAADPQNIDTQLALGQGYLVQKQYAKAVTALKVVLDTNPDRAEAYTGLGEAYFHQGKKQVARQSFEQAIRHYLLTGRRDLARQVQEKMDALRVIRGE